ncbi:hypothetical protein AAC387_Pa07g0015 [Persea americana]
MERSHGWLRPQWPLHRSPLPLLAHDQGCYSCSFSTPQRVCTPHHHLLLFPHPGSGARQAVPHLCAENRIGFALDRTLATLSFTCTRGAPTWMGPSGSLSPCHHREPTATSSRPIQSSLGSWNAAISMRRWRWHGGQPKVSGLGTLSHLPPSLVSALV